MKDKLENIYFYYLDGNEYGLNILFEFEDNYLLFDSSSFLLLDKIDMLLFNWKKIDYEEIGNGVNITEIREDENVSYFVKISNGDIFYIYQKVYDLSNWEQDFEIIRKNSLKYSEIIEYMNEDWVETVNPSPPDYYDLTK